MIKEQQNNSIQKINHNKEMCNYHLLCAHATKNNSYYNSIHNNVRNFIQSYFTKKRKIYVSNISILEKSKIHIEFTYYSKKRKMNYLNYKKELQILRTIIEEIYGKKVIITVNRVRYPFINAQIFAINLSKNLYNFRRIRKAVRRNKKLMYNTAKTNRFLLEIYKQKQNLNVHYKTMPIKEIKIPFTIKGIKIQLHGRLLKERFKPRKTQKTFIFGNLNNANYVDQGFYTSSNRKGSFTIKV